MPCPRGECPRFLKRVLMRQKDSFLDGHIGIEPGSVTHDTSSRTDLHHSSRLLQQTHMECQADAVATVPRVVYRRPTGRARWSGRRCTMSAYLATCALEEAIPNIRMIAENHHVDNRPIRTRLQSSPMFKFIRVTKMYAVTAIEDIVLSIDVESVSGQPTKCG
jgi:hypothetical protein